MSGEKKVVILMFPKVAAVNCKLKTWKNAASTAAAAAADYLKVD